MKPHKLRFSVQFLNRPPMRVTRDTKGIHNLDTLFRPSMRVTRDA